MVTVKNSTGGTIGVPESEKSAMACRWNQVGESVSSADRRMELLELPETSTMVTREFRLGMMPEWNMPLLLPPAPGPGYERFSNRKQARGISCAESL